jgi:hypothetical protein
MPQGVELHLLVAAGGGILQAVDGWPAFKAIGESVGIVGFVAAATRPARSAPITLRVGLSSLPVIGRKNKWPRISKLSRGLTVEAYSLIKTSPSVDAGVAISLSCRISGGPYRQLLPIA